MKPTLLVADEVMRGLRQAAAAGLPNEVGGILMGGLSDGRPWVSAFAEIPSVTPSPSRYRIPRGVTREIVAAAQDGDPRLGYLGDWHSHPANVEPSSTDRATLIRAASDPATGTENPLLVVLRQVEDQWQIDILETRGRRHVPCRVEATGAPPPPPAKGSGKGSPTQRRRRGLWRKRA
jgi:proteasome lid subunit RPN8/RPN11